MKAKTCTKCKKSLPMESFSWKQKAKNKRSPVCKACHNAYKRKLYATVKKSRKRTLKRVQERKKNLGA